MKRKNLRISFRKMKFSYTEAFVSRGTTVLKGFTKVNANRLFLIDDSSQIRSNGVKLRHRQLQLAYTKFFFTNDVMREWSKIPPSMVQCNTINSFKNKLDHLLQQGL